ncbi:MAG: PqqD family protein [Acidobacteriota bacterium]
MENLSELDEVHILNPVARVIFKLFQEGRSVSEIEEEIRNSFALKGDEEITEDIARCIEDLKNKGLLAG